MINHGKASVGACQVKSMTIKQLVHKPGEMTSVEVDGVIEIFRLPARMGSMLMEGFAH